MKNKNWITGIAAIAITAAVIYGYVYVAGKSWSKATSQN